MNHQETHTLAGGFEDAPRDAARAFRAALNAMARPGEIETVSGATPPPGLSQAAGVLLLTLADPETTLLLAGAYDTEDLRHWIGFHCGAPIITDPGQSGFRSGHMGRITAHHRLPHRHTGIPGSLSNSDRRM